MHNIKSKNVHILTKKSTKVSGVIVVEKSEKVTNLLIYQLYLYQIIAMALGKLTENIFYTIEKSVKDYRKYAQKNIKATGSDLTIDQYNLLKSLQENPDFTQQQIAELLFKDYASVTRMIELLVKKAYLTRTIQLADRRRFDLVITAKGEQSLAELISIIKNNRNTALQSISKKELEHLNMLLKKISSNCESEVFAYNQ